MSFLPDANHPPAHLVAQDLIQRDIESRASGIEAEVILDIARRQQAGVKKYGTTVADNPLTPKEWAHHLYEELLDAAIYIKRLSKDL